MIFKKLLLIVFFLTNGIAYAQATHVNSLVQLVNENWSDGHEHRALVDRPDRIQEFCVRDQVIELQSALANDEVLKKYRFSKIYSMTVFVDDNRKRRVLDSTLRYGLASRPYYDSGNFLIFAALNSYGKCVVVPAAEIIEELAKDATENFLPEYKANIVSQVNQLKTSLDYALPKNEGELMEPRTSYKAKTR